MKQNIFIAIRLTLVCTFVFTGIYTLLILGIAQAAPNKGLGETITVNNKVVGYKLEGQKFTDDKYFNSRPSAVDYNAAGSGGSNKSPANPEYLKTVQERIDTFLVHNPTVKKEQIPADLVTASGSGLDPDISPEGAYVQVARIAKMRNTSADKIKSIVDQNVQKPLAGLFGTAKVNVLQLNIDLDKIK